MEKVEETAVQDDFNGSVQEEELQDRYNKMVQNLVENQGMSPRKARRYLDSIAKKNLKKMLKKRK